MTKIEAVSKLLSGDCDYIRYGVSVFVLHNDDVVNKRSKKPIDMKHMMQEEWEAIVEPKWYDNLSENPVLCWVDNSSISLISAQRENGDFEDSIGNVYVSAEPVTMSEVKKYIYESKDSSTIDVEPELETPLAKGEEPPFTGGFVGVMDPAIDTQVFKDGEPESGNEECQNETLKTTVTQKDEVTFSGISPEVEKHKNYFITLGLPEELWFEFTNMMNFDAISISEFINSGDETCRNEVSSFIASRNEATKNEEIPF